MPASRTLVLSCLLLLSAAGLTQANEPEPGPVGEDATGAEATPSEPDDYQASEQISEDLPVSFPVDI